MAAARTGKTNNEADQPSSPVLHFGADKPLKLDAGTLLSPFQIAYQTYGTLNDARSNAILVCHALTGDQHVANTNPVTGKPGWWEVLIGPGKIIDTKRFFVICSNVIGGCLGSTGPASTNPATGKPYGLDLPIVTIRDMVRAQLMLIDHFGIEKLFCVLGGSMGGMQVLEWASSYPERVFSALPIATGARHSSQNIAFHEVGRQAVMADPDWHGGKYFDYGKRPEKGLAVARMAAHITYLSEAALHRKFGRNLQDREALTFGFDADFPDRELSAPPGHDLRRPLRRQFLSLHDPVDGLFRSRRRSWRTAGRCLRRHQDPFLPGLLYFGLAVPDRGKPLDRPCAERRGRISILRRDRDRPWPRRLPARRAGTFRRDQRLHRLCGAGERTQRMTLEICRLVRPGSCAREEAKP